MKDKLRRRVIYFGRVQNVGFRWNVSNILSKFSLTGYVKNLDDGSVEVLLEGEDIEVKSGTIAVDRKMQSYWKRKKLEDNHGKPHFSSFSIIK